MPRYRRMFVPGGTYAFTVCLAGRGTRTLTDNIVDLRSAYTRIARERPFETVAICILPDHLHTVWRLPDGDSDYPTRWQLIKTHFTRALGRRVWQNRYWEHTITDQNELGNCIDYVHGNPVKHRLVTDRDDWPFSSWHRFKRENQL